MIYMLQMDALLTAGVLITYPIMLGISNYVSKKLKSLAEFRRTQLDQRTEMAYDGINGMVVGRSYNLFQTLSEQLFAVIEKIFQNEERRTRLSSASHVMQDVISWIPTIACYVFALLEVIRGEITVGQMIAFVALLEKITQAISEFPFYINDFKEYSVSIKRLEEIFRQPDEVSGKLMSKPQTVLASSDNQAQMKSVIEFDKVSFSYDGERTIFKQLSFDVKQGSTVAFVGASGQGKSTVFHIICGFYRPQKGIYKLYGRPFEEWNLESARKEIALVSQNAFLFPESIEKNISYGRPGATKEEIIEACKMANIHEFIMSLSNGYDTIVGQRGSTVSGGERQRIAIARAILKDAPILLLDEATSALDNDSERLVSEAIDRLSKGRTTLMIAHRPSTIARADRVVNM